MRRQIRCWGNFSEAGVLDSLLLVASRQPKSGHSLWNVSRTIHASTAKLKIEMITTQHLSSKPEWTWSRLQPTFESMTTQTSVGGTRRLPSARLVPLRDGVMGMLSPSFVTMSLEGNGGIGHLTN